MGAYDNCIILIPTLQSDERLIQMIHGLHERFFIKLLLRMMEVVMIDRNTFKKQK